MSVGSKLGAKKVVENRAEEKKNKFTQERREKKSKTKKRVR